VTSRTLHYLRNHPRLLRTLAFGLGLVAVWTVVTQRRSPVSNG
jgi:hypothetical protein